MITLLTDLGTRDSYVAEMKSVILRLNPRATIVDVTHEVAPQAVAEGAVALGRALRIFAADTVHVGVVDPGVGTDRRAILMVTPDGRFLAPDNGLLTYALREAPEYEEAIAGAEFLQTAAMPVPAGAPPTGSPTRRCGASRLATRSTGGTCSRQWRRTCRSVCRRRMWANP